MSGNGLDAFLTAHHTDDIARLMQKAKNGMGTNKYKAVDYGALKALAAEKRKQGLEAANRMKRLQDTAKQCKESTLLKQHKLVWQKEFARLKLLRKRLESELDLLLNESLINDMTSPVFENLETYRDFINTETNDFKKNTVDPVWTLRNDIKLWNENFLLGEKRDLKLELDDPEVVEEMITSIEHQQGQIMEKLLAEKIRLETELNAGCLIDSNIPAKDRVIETGIPEEAFNLECPSLNLKASVLQEFILIDGKYVEKLAELEDMHQDVLCLQYGGWSEADHSVFIYANEQYMAHEIENRRTLHINFLLKILPHKTRSNIVDHEEWWSRYRYYHQRYRDMLNDWIRDRTELFNRAADIFNEACLAKLMQEQKLENRQKQQEYCDALYAKVCTWREQKLEAMRLELEIAKERQQAMAATIAAENEKQQQKLKEKKMKIQEYHDVQNAKRLELIEKKKKRLDELKQFLTEQAVYDRERVKYREAELLNKEQERMRRLEEQKAADAEKEEILEAIRQKVRPHVECDLLRLWSDTIAWQVKQKPEPDVCIQQPLFDVRTFTTEQVMADSRFRLDQRLREAGLQGTTYARDAIAQMKPFRPPRRDMESNVFRNT